MRNILGKKHIKNVIFEINEKHFYKNEVEYIHTKSIFEFQRVENSVRNEER